jgi:RNA polymerase sigma-70 factor (ECF subfamily)
MTRNALTDHHRRRVRRERQLERLAAQVDDEDSIADPGGDGSNGLSTFADCVGPMVAALPEPYGSAVRRVDLEGASQVAFARELGLSPSGAKSRVQRGRAMLREAFLRCCIAERTATNASGRFERGACLPGTDLRRCGDGAPAGECPPRPPNGQG